MKMFVEIHLPVKQKYKTVNQAISLWKSTVSMMGLDSGASLSVARTLLTKRCAGWTHIWIYKIDQAKDCNAFLWVFTLPAHWANMSTIPASFSSGTDIMPVTTLTSIHRHGIQVWGAYSLLSLITRPSLTIKVFRNVNGSWAFLGASYPIKSSMLFVCLLVFLCMMPLKLSVTLCMQTEPCL